VLGGNRYESGIIILYSASEEGYPVLALYKHALYYYINQVKTKICKIVICMCLC